MLETAPSSTSVFQGHRQPKLGFVGVGWIGRNRLDAIANAGVGEISAVADTSPETISSVQTQYPGTHVVARFEDLLALDLDGIVIATPNALHATQAIAALESGKAVFCQKPLARTALETQQVIAAATAADRLLGVDLSYRETAGMQAIKRLIASGELGNIYAAELVFHNAYGPDKPWFYDARLSGGGCLLDLGIHLIDLGLWCLDYPRIEQTSCHLMAGGRKVQGAVSVEDYAAAQLYTANGTTLQLACSWNVPAGYDAKIEVNVFGTRGGASFRNVNGSFYDFVAERYSSDRHRQVLSQPPDAWGGRAAIAWARQLAIDSSFDPAILTLQHVANVIDRLYARES
jgi:predicted dehydrogenase